MNGTVERCAKKCTGAADCVAFNIYLGGPPACYIYHTKVEAPFVAKADCFTCVRNKRRGSVADGDQL